MRQQKQEHQRVGHGEIKKEYQAHHLSHEDEWDREAAE